MWVFFCRGGRARSSNVAESVEKQGRAGPTRETARWVGGAQLETKPGVTPEPELDWRAGQGLGEVSGWKLRPSLPPPLPARPPGACGLAASRLACRACLRAVRPGGLSASAHAGYLEPSIGVNLVREAVKCFPGGPGQALPRESCTLLIILSTSSIQTNSGNTRLLIAGIRFSDIVHFLCGGRAFGRPK